MSRPHGSTDDRQVCSSRCNDTLKQWWRAKVKKGGIPGFEPAPGPRAPRRFRTLPVTEPFPYEFDTFPTPGDVIERHGHETLYELFRDCTFNGVTLTQEVPDEC